MIAGIKLVYGVGVNDANYPIKITEVVGYRENGNRIQKTVWKCPFYTKWSHMLMRCYSDLYTSKNSSYIGCYTVPEWHYFMNFRAWMETQDWEGKHLDKDILFPGNKLYSPDTCVLVDAKVNGFLTESAASRGEWPIGVSFNKTRQRFESYCRNVITSKKKNLGMFDTPQEAHQAWLTFKLEQAKILASQQTDPRVAAALIDRY